MARFTKVAITSKPDSLSVPHRETRTSGRRLIWPTEWLRETRSSPGAENTDTPKNPYRCQQSPSLAQIEIEQYGN